MKKTTVVMDFSGVYREEKDWKGKDFQYLDFSRLSGVNCYCSFEAEEEIRRRIAPFSYEGIHFLDSGNYHYLSKFWLEKIREPFSLLVFDNHTDMQESSFFGLLSCGSWVLETLKSQENLQEVCLIGPSEKDFLKIAKEDRAKVTLLSKEELKAGRTEKLESFLEGRKTLPLYLSIDKDILQKEDARTNWDQGETALEELEGWIRRAFSERRILGADVCGEETLEGGLFAREEEREINRQTDGRLFNLLKDKLEGK